MSDIKILIIPLVLLIMSDCGHRREISADVSDQIDTLMYSATEDFILANTGNTAFYRDKSKKGNLAIDPIKHRDSAASAFVIYRESGGIKQVALQSYYEYDGESRYTLAINSDTVARFVNPAIPDKRREGNYMNLLGTFNLTTGDTLWLHAQSHSNLKYPEEGAPGGFAWSRGRWSALLLTDP